MEPGSKGVCVHSYKRSHFWRINKPLTKYQRQKDNNEILYPDLVTSRFAATRKEGAQPLTAKEIPAGSLRKDPQAKNIIARYFDRC